MAKSRSNPSAVQERRRLRNMAVRSSVRTAVKKAERTIASGDNDAVQPTLQKAVSLLDKASSKGVLHRKTASRKISRLMKRAHSLPTQR